MRPGESGRRRLSFLFAEGCEVAFIFGADVGWGKAWTLAALANFRGDNHVVPGVSAARPRQMISSDSPPRLDLQQDRTCQIKWALPRLAGECENF